MHPMNGFQRALIELALLLAVGGALLIAAFAFVDAGLAMRIVGA